VKDALTTLPWVEPASIRPDRAKRQVRFAVTDRGQFDMAAVASALEKQGYTRAAKLAGPTEPDPPEPTGP
jgi:hypothetical protein